jgi:hypothetical protein
MGVFVVHDNSGKIKSVGTPSKGLIGQVGMRASGKDYVTEIELPNPLEVTKYEASNAS